MSFSPPNWIKPFGPRRLQEIIKQIQDEVTFRSPIPGCGIDISEEPTGRVISTKTDSPPASTIGGGTGQGGTPVDLYGALNGAPAVFHLLQSSPPTLVP